MLYYFSGLGNTRYVAEKIGRITGEDIGFIPDIEAGSEKVRGESIGFLFPVYSWGIPENVMFFLMELPNSFWNDILKKGLPVWMICTCGDETGDAPAILEEILLQRGIVLIGKWSVIMPNTYVLLPGFNVDSKEVETKKLNSAKEKIKEIGEKIKNKKWEDDVHRGSFPKLRTKIIYPLFLKKGIDTRKWHHSNACVKCGKCIKVCSQENIYMGDDGPVWRNQCISCLACYHYCPYHAVEYGKVTKNKGQYTCPL